MEMTAFFFFSRAQSTAGTRYASDLPTPVPASTTRCSSDRQRSGHRHRHLLLLWPVFEVLCVREAPVRRKHRADALDKLVA